MMTSSTRGILLALVNVLIPIACAIFASGFFPYKPYVPGLAEYHDLEYGPPPAAPFDKVIFMVIDALRSDFVFSRKSGFAFTQQLIKQGSAIPFTSQAAAPTVTMPRLKAITTGSIPSFVDMILNLAESDTTSSLAAQDTWLAQMRRKNRGKIIMYGDDTWIKLFPGMFDRADGTSSFFVSDFTEVDNNVTRHIPDELNNSDWNVMIMHYLGMDHIGHKAGPLSINMVPKQTEMDGIARQIYTAIENNSHLQSTLFVMCGDHGMTDGGNHGGSAPGETSPALVFMSPKFSPISTGRDCPTDPSGDFDYYDKVEQSDIAPTLAGLLGFPVPLNNLGIFIPQLLSMWPEDNDQIQLLLRNALQMLGIVKASFPHQYYDNKDVEFSCEEPASNADILACSWREVNNVMVGTSLSQSSSQEVKSALYKFCKEAQHILSGIASNYNLPRMYNGVAIALLCVVVSLLVSASSSRLVSSRNGAAFVGVAMLYTVMMFASSYVEEEQQFWYWTSTAWLMVGFHAGTIISSCLLAVALRFVRRWVQSGQKHAGAPDINTYLRREAPGLLWALTILTLADCSYKIYTDTLRGARRRSLPSIVAAASLFTFTLIFKAQFIAADEPELLGNYLDLVKSSNNLYFGNLVVSARLVFAGIGLCFGTSVYSRITRQPQGMSFIERIHPLITLLVITQSRLANIPLFLLYSVQLFILKSVSTNRLQITLSTLLLSYASFFAMGGTNSISTVDLSQAYNGIADYNISLVGILLFIGNWAGPVYWSSAGILLLSHNIMTSPQTLFNAWLSHAELLTVWSAVSVAGVMVACAALRTHLFVWTVFSPKFLYAMAWAILWHGVLNVILGGLLAAIG